MTTDTPLPEPATPQCVHFGTCGGCQYQDITAASQLELKRASVHNELLAAGLTLPATLRTHSAEPYEYRNRIRLRIERVNGQLHLGYNLRATTDFLPITMCPIAAPVLWSVAQLLLRAAALDPDAAFWLNAASEVELFASDDLQRLQLTLLCAPRTKARPGSLARCFNALQRETPQLIGLGAIATDPRTGPTGRVLDATGAAGLNYRVADETYWITRGGFFQVNRFLLDTLVPLACTTNGLARSGDIAWDLYAGVGLFSRVLARTFARVVAVEASETAAADNRAALKKLSPAHEVVTATTLDFLRRAIVQRERPSLIVLDPPRAGAGAEACELLLRLAAPHIVYVSCDPATLARDLAVLAPAYTLDTVDVLDLFPQTAHVETVVVLQRKQ